MKRLFLTGILAAALVFNCSNKDRDIYVPTDTNTDSGTTDYDDANGSLGGIMYDKLWAKESGFDQNHENYETISANGDFFRCKQCHGWDGLGNKGAYIGRAPKATRPKVSGLNLYALAKSKTAQELFDGIKKSEGRRSIDYDFSTFDPTDNASEGNKMPDYSKLLTDEEIWNMVKFLKAEMRNVKELYDFTTDGTYPTGTITYSNIGKDGDAEKGKTFYTANCAQCHGNKGTDIDIEGKSVGTYGRTKAYEVQHKVTYGQPGSTMKGLFIDKVSDSDIRDLYKALQNETDFPDLP